jgi:hypothetical protein
MLVCAGMAQAVTWGRSAIVERDGDPVFTVDGKPFFVYGAAFFYERLPADRWEESIIRLRALGINTLDLYVPWNWHELRDGDFDFSGRTSPRRDLRRLLGLARRYDLRVILRPGPVIRNEWRNGGYPAWLLGRPEYGMPLHDLLEGRYPPTATLQNAHSDDAAAQWMRNATHVRYARRWLERVLREFAPIADRVLAVAIDDDQGAYLDNQTWPAPNLRVYLEWLRGVVHGVTGPRVPVFINTYNMKVTASSPVWAMGNWYQSSAYSIGEHDRAELEFSTGLLQTRPAQPLMLSEFQAGWLQAPDDVRPRPVDPSNTALALATVIGMGARGIINFPAQDTLYPSGMEVPFANAFYAWDAALRFGPSARACRDGRLFPHEVESARYVPTEGVGRFVATFGKSLAGAPVVADAAVAYLASAFDERTLSQADIDAIAERTIETQRTCRALSLTCKLVDLRFISDRALRRYPILIVPWPGGSTTLHAPIASVAEKLRSYRRAGGVLVETRGTFSPADARLALARAHRMRVVEGAPGATFARATDASGRGFLVIPNYSDTAVSFSGIRLRPDGRHAIPIAPFAIGARDALIAPIDLLRGVMVASRYGRDRNASEPCPTGETLPIRDDAGLVGTAFRPVSPGSAIAYESDVYREGSPSVVLENALVRVVVALGAGARAFVFEDKVSRRNIFSTVGALRDDVKLEPPPSTTDRIAAYTHLMPAGMFNRPYRSEILASGTDAAARFSYTAPDVIPAGAKFVRTLRLEPGAREFSVEEQASFDGAPSEQRAVSVTSLEVGDTARTGTQVVLAPDPTNLSAGTALTVSGNALGYYDRGTRELATIAWCPTDVENAAILERQFSIIARLTLAPGRVARSRYGYENATSIEAARRALEAAGAAAAAGCAMPSPAAR